jgi:hypothetical protein
MTMSRYPKFDRLCRLLETAAEEADARALARVEPNLTFSEFKAVRDLFVAYADSVGASAALAESLVTTMNRYGIKDDEPVIATLEREATARDDEETKALLDKIAEEQRDIDEAARRLEISWWKPGSRLDYLNYPEQPPPRNDPNVWLFGLRAGLLDETRH